MDPATIKAYIAKINRINDGHKEIVSDAFLDWVADHDEDASINLRTVPNKERRGLLDAYIAWIGEPLETTE